MADITVNKDNVYSSATYQAMIQSLNEAAKTEGASFEASVADKTLTITAKGADGAETKVQIPIPELDAPSGPLDVGTLNNIVAKLTQLSNAATLSTEQQAILGKFLGCINSLSASLSTPSGPSSSSSKSILMDVYRMMALLQEVAQKQRDAARELRQAENLRVQASIQSQADAQREAAFLGMLLSACVCAVQVGISFIGMARQASAANQQSKMADAYGVNTANKNLQSTMEVSPRLTEARGDLAAVEADLKGAGVYDKVQAELKTDFAASNTTEAQLNVTEEGAVNATEQLQQAKILEGTATSAEAKATATASVDRATTLERNASEQVQQQQQTYAENYRTDLQAMRQRGQAEIQRLTQQKNTLEAKNQQLASPEGQQATRNSLEAQKAQLEANRARIAGPAPIQQKVVASIDAELAKINEQLQQPNPNAAQIEANTARIAQIDQKIQTRTTINDAKVRFAEAQQRVKQIEHSADYKAVRNIGKAGQTYETAMSMMKTDQAYIQATRTEGRWSNILSINMATGNMLSGIAQSISQIMQSEATRQGAEQQEAQENLNMAKEIFDQAQKIIDSVRQLMVGVLQSENQSISQIVQKV